MSEGGREWARRAMMLAIVAASLAASPLVVPPGWWDTAAPTRASTERGAAGPVDADPSSPDQPAVARDGAARARDPSELARELLTIVPLRAPDSIGALAIADRGQGAPTMPRSPQAPPPPDPPPGSLDSWSASLGWTDGALPDHDAGVPFQVTLYGADWCGYTRQARAWLRTQGVAAADHDVDADPRARARLIELNPRGSIPTFEARGHVLVGFSPAALAHLIAGAAAEAP